MYWFSLCLFFLLFYMMYLLPHEQIFVVILDKSVWCYSLLRTCVCFYSSPDLGTRGHTGWTGLSDDVYTLGIFQGCLLLIWPKDRVFVRTWCGLSEFLWVLRTIWDPVSSKCLLLIFSWRLLPVERWCGLSGFCGPQTYSGDVSTVSATHLSSRIEFRIYVGSAQSSSIPLCEIYCGISCTSNNQTFLERTYSIVRRDNSMPRTLRVQDFLHLLDLGSFVGARILCRI